MKKITSFISAIAVMAVMTAPMSAFADTTIQPTGGTPFSVDPKPGTANTTVQFEVNPAYTVTIPATVTLTGEYGSTYTGSGKISTDKVFLNEGKKIVVSLTSASKFNMKTEETKEYQLPYTAEGAFGKLTDKANGGKVAEFETSTTAETVDISFTTDETPKYAGSYTDPVVFTISVEDDITLSLPKTAQVSEWDIVDIFATVSPVGNYEYEWSTSGPLRIADYIPENGVVIEATGVGTGTVTVKVGNKTATCTVTCTE